MTLQVVDIEKLKRKRKRIKDGGMLTDVLNLLIVAVTVFIEAK